MEHVLSLLSADDDAVIARTGPTYDEDPHAWAIWQAELIRKRRFDELDLENLADEVEDVARRERKELVSRLSLVVQHLVKWDYQPQRRSASWARTLREQRRQVIALIDEMPSVRPLLPSLFEEAFKQGRIAALNETGLSDADIPEANPYEWADMMDRTVAWPEL